MSRRDGERGAVLVWALLLTMAAAALGGILLDRGRAMVGAAQEDAATLRALHAAEGGVAAARVRLASDPAYAGETLTIGACDVTVEVVRDGDGEGDGWRVRSHAKRGSALVEATLRPRSGSLPAVTAWRGR